MQVQNEAHATPHRCAGSYTIKYSIQAPPRPPHDPQLTQHAGKEVRCIAREITVEQSQDRYI